MSTEEQAREALTKQRHHDEHLQESMLDRAEAEIDNPDHADNMTQEHARELLAQQRHHDEHLKETMLNRAQSDISISYNITDTSIT